MKLVVESGATRTQWRAFNGSECKKASTSGINFATMDPKLVGPAVADAFAQLGTTPAEITDMWIYGAGLLEKSALLDILFPNAVIRGESDLLAAARAVCGHKPGIAVIMGTGSNSCFFDGQRIVKNVHSSGFILGDEGSGAALGRMFMADFLKELQPKELMEEFSRDFTVDYLTVVKNVYRGDAPSTYLASFAPWICERKDRFPYVRSLMERNFREFMERSLLQYDIKAYPAGVVGGFGCANEQMVQSIAAEFGFQFSSFMPATIDALAAYHMSEE